MMKALLFKQLISLKRKSLEARFDKYYKETNDAAYLIQAAVTILVRNAFSPFDYSYVAKELITDLFLTSDPRTLETVRHLCFYFEPYFSTSDWNKVINRLFDSKKEYLQLTHAARSHTAHILPMLHSGKREATDLKNLALTFFDESGKKHRCTLKDVDRKYSTQENVDILSILGTLTIFEKDGVRRFAQVAKSRFITAEDDYNLENKEEQAQPWLQPIRSQEAASPANQVENKESGESTNNQQANDKPKSDSPAPLSVEQHTSSNNQSPKPAAGKEEFRRRTDEKYKKLLEQEQKKRPPKQQNQQPPAPKKPKKKNRKRKRRK